MLNCYFIIAVKLNFPTCLFLAYVMYSSCDRHEGKKKTSYPNRGLNTDHCLSRSVLSELIALR